MSLRHRGIGNPTVGFALAIPILRPFYGLSNSLISRRGADRQLVSNNRSQCCNISMAINRGNFDLSVYLVSDRRTAPGSSVENIVQSAVLGVNQKHVTFLQLRDKNVPRKESVTLGNKLRQITHGTNIAFVVNDDIELALELGADGVHLGQDDESVKKARSLLGADAIIGISAGTIQEAEQAIRDGADYIGVGSVFPTLSKPDAGDPIGPEGLRKIVDVVRERIPVVAIGGVTMENANLCRQAGASGVAVVSAIMKSTKPDEVAAKIYETMTDGSNKNVAATTLE